MEAPREFRARVEYAVGAALGYGACILVSAAYMAGRQWANFWPVNLVVEAVLLAASTWGVLQSYSRIWVGTEDVVMRLPRWTHTIKWADLAAYELSGKGNSICTLRSFSGTTIRFRFKSFENRPDLEELIDRLATKTT